MYNNLYLVKKIEQGGVYQLSSHRAILQRAFLTSKLHTDPFCRYVWLDVSIYFNLKETLLYALNWQSRKMIKCVSTNTCFLNVSCYDPVDETYEMTILALKNVVFLYFAKNYRYWPIISS